MSKIWKHFKISCNDPGKAECLLRDRSSTSRFITRGKSSRNYSTKLLWNHLERKHARELRTLQEKKEQEETPSTSQTEP